MSWRDVSRECEFSESDMALKLGDELIFGILSPHGRKIRLTKISGPLTPHVAFIVEKQE